ncbi:SCO family protein [Kitasatospora sp. RB6PN24]|uniref:SCO family protein n=1 Tax=Kitasatospora humi TaxID=2893891 RepID=UPI001E3DCA36|nr:SCO family protein [Kitasatospora humi]MCC9310976.1 SCO family protein [Kitasatospora humi]
MRPFACSARRAAAIALSAAAALSLSACGGPAGGPQAAPAVSTLPSAPDGAVALPQPFAKPHLVLTDDDGQPYDLAKQTAGKPTLLYFDYTHGPDVCRTTMTDIADAARSLPPGERAKLQVVFVTTDPARDTVQRLRQWLGAFDPTFVGLTGDFTTIQSAARSVGIAVSTPVQQTDGSYRATSSAEVLVFSAADDKAHARFPSGVSVPQYQDALPAIARGATL